jgi:hypothetical protein
VTNFAAWLAKKRKFAMDMAGFALNVEVLWKYHPIRFNTTRNYMNYLLIGRMNLPFIDSEL